jgi:hypothetical protein
VASKSPTGAQSAVADAVGLSADQVTLQWIRGGGLLRAADLLRAGSRGSARVEGDWQACEAYVDSQRLTCAMGAYGPAATTSSRCARSW